MHSDLCAIHSNAENGSQPKIEQIFHVFKLNKYFTFSLEAEFVCGRLDRVTR